LRTSAERIEVAAWLSFAKLVLHPAAVAAACWLFGVSGYAAGVMIAAAALPVAGNVFILAQHYGVRRNGFPPRSFCPRRPRC
jgi:malonate transporter and related proteins